MKCSKCGTEFEGRFCPVCGSPAGESGYDQKKDPFSMDLGNTIHKHNKKKPIYKKPWFIIAAIVAVLILIVVFMPGKSSSVKIDWAELELGDKLPIPTTLTGKVWTNTEDKLKVDIDDVSDSEYSDYIDACKAMDYTVEAEKDSYSYYAYNKEGYKLYITLFSDEMDILLESPMQFSTIIWPDSVVGNLLPVPKSLQGNFSYEHDTSFLVYISETSQEDYAEYVQKVQNAGFKVDYNKGDTYYYADNADGYHVSIKYIGFNTMSISISSPSESDDDIFSDSSEETDADTETESEPETKNTPDSKGLRPDFKAAMDSYEEFIDEYVDFMKKLEKDPDNTTLLLEYADYMSKYTECMEAFDKWEDEDLNDDELDYYIEVQSRVNKKLLNVAY